MSNLLNTVVSFFDVKVVSTLVTAFVAGWLVKQPEWVRNLFNSVVEKLKTK